MVREKIILGDLIFKTKKETETYVRKMLNDVGCTLSVKQSSEYTFRVLEELCRRHPDYESKMRNFEDFIIKPNAMNHKSKELNIRKTTGVVIDISWKLCITGKPRTQESHFNEALRFAIQTQIYSFREKHQHVQNCSICEKYFENDSQIDHIVQFQELVLNFMKLHPEIKLPSNYSEENETNKCCFQVRDTWIGDLFSEYHEANATLRKVCRSCNLTRPKFKQGSKMN